MKSKINSRILALAVGVITTLGCLPATTYAQGTAFTYQGRLNDGSNPANGRYDVRVALYDALSLGSQQGNLLTNSATLVSNGLFTVTLDFGNQFPGANRWLEIGVRTNGAASFFTLSPRQPLTPAPYAITAGSVISGGLASGTYGNAVTLNNSANQISGTFSGNGANVANVNAATLGGISSSGFWKTTGNAGTSAGANYIGTSDSAKLLVRGSFVGVNRSSQISPQEVFGIDSQTANSDFGGMYINTTNGTGLPFYGYALAGGVYAYHYVDGLDAFKWKLAFGGASGPAITAVPNGGNTQIGISTANPQAHLHVYSANNPTVARLQSSGTPGFGRLEFVSNPQGDANEWRPGYIQSSDNGGFTGGLAFFVNGTGAGSKFGNTEVMRVVNGAVGIGTTTPVSALQVVGTVTATAFNPPSDRNLKENFTPVNPREVLAKVAAMPISRWNFIGDAATPHVGPMAQDFHAAFGLGTDERHIATVDADGVALAAIQGLNQKLVEQRAANEELKQQVAELKQLVQTLLPKH